MRIHVIFKTHLDVGFTNTAENVLARYFERFIPGAIKLAREMRESGARERFVWTVGSFLIYEFLERAGGEERRMMEQAIQSGDIVWHALPFTTHTELLDESLFRFGLSLSARLDRRFGKKTIAAKLTDVPGHTRSVIPLLKEAGVEFLHVGVNSASTPPDVPPLFVWREPSGAELIVMYQKTYGDTMVLPGSREAVALNFTGDNHGPQSPEQVTDVYRKLEELFPGSEVVASTLNDCAKALLTVKDSLPVVTQELGDTWIHGTGTDPLKVARYKELCRLRKSWLANGKLQAGSDLDCAFSLPLLMVAEHTWGMDEKSHLRDHENYRTPDFQRARAQENFRVFESSWAEKRAYIDKAVAVLGDSPLARTAREALPTETQPEPDLAGYSRTGEPGNVFSTARFEIGFDPGTGAIRHLRDGRTGRNWASERNPLAALGYQTFSAQDYHRFAGQYLRHRAEWAIEDFTKPGIENAGATDRWITPALESLYHRRREYSDSFVLNLRMAGMGGADVGCPPRLSLIVELPADPDAPIALDLRWFTKPAYRLPEATWLAFSPKVSRADGWTMRKVGRRVDPLDVVPDGNRHLHAVDEYVSYADESGRLEIRSLDAVLVAPGAPSLLDFNNRRPPMLRGMHFNLHNNVWGTNFPMWSEGDARFRFELSIR